MTVQKICLLLLAVCGLSHAFVPICVESNLWGQKTQYPVNSASVPLPAGIPRLTLYTNPNGVCNFGPPVGELVHVCDDAPATVTLDIYDNFVPPTTAKIVRHGMLMNTGYSYVTYYCNNFATQALQKQEVSAVPN